MSRANRSYSRFYNRERPSERQRCPFPYGQTSPIPQRRRSRSPLRDRETENQFHWRRHHPDISQRYGTQLRQRHQDTDVPMVFTPPEVDRNQPDPGSIQSPHQLRQRHWDPDVPMVFMPPEVDRNQPDPGSIQSPHQLHQRHWDPDVPMVSTPPEVDRNQPYPGSIQSPHQLRQRHWDPDVPMVFTPHEVDLNQPDPGSIQNPHQLRQRHWDPDVPMVFTQPEVDPNQPYPGCIHSPHLHDSTCPICQERFPWHMKRTIDIENYGTLTIMVPGSLWASRATFSIGFDNGEPTLQVLPGQDSPIPHIRESRTLIWAREPEEQLLQSSRSNENPERNDSTSDQNQAEPESAQTPPSNQESDENPERNDSTLDQNQAEPESAQTPPSNQESDELPECSVCLLEIEEEDKSSRLPCSHQFHDECITRWMEKSRTCPNCRAGVNYHIWSAFNVPNYGQMAVITPGLLSSLQPPVRIDFDREALTLRIHTPTRDE